MLRQSKPNSLRHRCLSKGIGWNIVMAAVLLHWGSPPAQSQTTFATITGTVTDSSGAVVPNARIVVKNLATNIETSAASNEAGNYTVPQLKEGTYSLAASAAGFKEFVVQDVVLAARDIRRVDVILEVGAAKTVVEVKGGATVIETETARIADTKDANVLNTLPLNTRSIWAPLALSPTVQQAGFGSSTIRFAGSTSNQSNWAIDGITFSDGVDNTQIGPLANFIEAFEEVKIEMTNNSAEVGTIGQVTIVSKSGTNNFHGSVLEYYSTNAFRARNPFSLTRPTGREHRPGFSAGGPVFIPKLYDGRNKTFFFFTYETARGSKESDVFSAGVAPAAWRKGDFSSLLPDTVIVDPVTKQPFLGNVIPSDRINAVSQKIQDRFFPLPNYGDTSNYTGADNFKQTLLANQYPVVNWSTRIDHHFSNKDWVFGRYTYGLDTWDPYDGPLPTMGNRHWRRHNDAAAVSYTHIFRPSVLNEFRWGFAYNNIPDEGGVNGLSLVKDLGLVGLAPDLPNIPGLFNIDFYESGLAGIWGTSYSNPGYRNHVEDFQDYVSIFRGRHNLKMGVDASRVAWDDYQAHWALFGYAGFSSRFSGFDYADFLLGIPTTSQRAFPPLHLNRNRWQYDFFVADDFKITSKVTVNLGLRYQLHQTWREDHNYISMFDIKSGNIVVPDAALSQISPLFPKGFVGVIGAKAAGVPDKSLLGSDKNNFAPRFGVAYRPWGPETVFRAGYGIFFDVAPEYLAFGGSPFQINELPYTNPETNPDVIFPRVFPSTGGEGPSKVGLPKSVNPGIRIPYSMQYSFTVEHQLGSMGLRASYIGTNTRQGVWGYNYNSPVPDARPFIDKPRPFPQYAAINYYTNGAGHQYNGLTLEARRRMTAGLQFQSSWTWARDIYDLDRDQLAENPFDRHRERAVAPSIATHRFTSNALYELPFGKGRHWGTQAPRSLNWVIGGWAISAVYSLYSGQFLTPQWTGPDPTGTAYTTSSTAPYVTIRPDQIGDPNNGPKTTESWFNPNAFAPPQLGRFGTSAKGVIKGPGVNVFHAGLYKTFPILESGLRARVELTATNVLNHPNWSNPRLNIASWTVGKITGVGGVNGGSTGDLPGPRTLRLGIRVEW